MADFLDALNGLYNKVKGTWNNGNSTSDDSPVCITKVPTSPFHLYLLVPSFAMMLLLACTMSRKNKWLTCFWGRPGAVFPMDILGKSNRFSYAAAWGAIAFLAADLVFGSTEVVKLEGPPYVTVFNTVLSMIVIGVDYFPLFAALALESVTGYIVGTAYAWMLLGVHIFKETECDLAYQARLILILRDVPNFLCLAYLSISLPVRTLQALYHKTVQLISSSEMVSILNLDKEVQKTPEAFHVKALLKPVIPPPPPPSTIKGKVVDLVKTLISNWIYHNHHKFRYSSRILSVMFVGLMLIYKATLEIMVIVISLLKFVEDGFITTLSLIGWFPEAGEDSYVTSIRDYTYLAYYFLINGRICFIVAMSLACASGVLSILHTLTSYRTNLFDLYKGDNTHIPHRSTRSNTSLLVGSMRYAGYQVAYIGWGLVLHCIIFFIVSVALMLIITMIQEGYYQWILTILKTAWPAVVMTLVVLLTQTLLSKFVFLQERGEVLAIDNRRVLFSFTFFMFFYNIFVGFLSCLLRIVKSIVIGAIFLPRLDNSTLPRRFQMFDPGFANYCGFIHVECAHTHPVLVMFMRLLLIENEKRKMESEKLEEVKVDKENKQSPMKSKQPNRKVRNRWCLLYTLNNNPTLRAYRKSHIRYMAELQERIAKRYNLNKSAMGKLVKHMNDAFATGGTAAIEDVEVSINEGSNPAQANWNALLGVNKFLKQIQRDLDMEQRAAAWNANNSINIDHATNSDNVASHDNKNFIHETHHENSVNVKSPSRMWKKAVLTSLTQEMHKPSETKL